MPKPEKVQDSEAKVEKALVLCAHHKLNVVCPKCSKMLEVTFSKSIFGFLVRKCA